ncbi:Uncharacterised protein [Mycobacteroides abscessus subsp. abscessus]|nr:Uncharacterised protein [Mycobacteroides abscessus subsp. abscessus]
MSLLTVTVVGPVAVPFGSVPVTVMAFPLTEATVPRMPSCSGRLPDVGAGEVDCCSFGCSRTQLPSADGHIMTRRAVGGLESGGVIAAMQLPAVTSDSCAAKISETFVD